MVLTRDEELAANIVANNIIEGCKKMSMNIKPCIGTRLDGLLTISDIANNLPTGRTKECAYKMVDIADKIKDLVISKA